MNARSHEHLGEPGLRVAGFQLWVHTPPFPDALDEGAFSWVNVTAHCGAAGASVWASGDILTLQQIERFGRQCEDLARAERSTARLDPIEPYLSLHLESIDRLGHLLLRVEITPEPGTSEHSFKFEIDQTYLPTIARQCAAIVADFRVSRPDLDPRL